jgi:hypothetical protein
MKKRLLISGLLLLLAAVVFAQKHHAGLIFDPDGFAALPVKANVISRDYDNLPPAYSLKEFCPPPGNQGDFGTCAAWTASYASRTILESIALSRTATKRIEAFSPLYLYKSLSADPTGQRGLSLNQSIDFLKKPGVPKIHPNGEDGDQFKSIDLVFFKSVDRFPIGDYAALYRSVHDPDYRIKSIKRAIIEKKPVPLAIRIDSSFHLLIRKDLWDPKSRPSSSMSGHGAVIIGYNDHKYGGAVEIFNPSWTSFWGNGGFAWIRYKDLTDYMMEAYELIEDMGLYQDTYPFSAAMSFETYFDGEDIPLLREQGYYRSVESFPPGTEFRLLIESRNPAWVYCFGTDETTWKTSLLFPRPGRNESAALNYATSRIALPEENSWIRVDETEGVSWLAILFSKKKLDIEAVRAAFESAQGNCLERLHAALPDHLISIGDAQNVSDSRADFSVKTTDKEAVVVLPVAITVKYPR